MKIGIVAASDPHKDRKAHSGILFKINEAIEEAGYETIWVQNPLPLSYKLICKLIALLGKIGFKTNIYFNYTTLGAKLMASTIDRKTADKCDYLLVLHHFHVPAYFKTDKPIIYHSDATFELANGYYFHNIPSWNVRQGDKIEQLALNNSAYNISPSNWRQTSIIETYNQSANKCVILEYGPCIENKNAKIYKFDGKSLKLFFSGVAWNRKGGDIAVDTAQILNERGIKTTLTIAGIEKMPDYCKGKDFIQWIGFLDKGNPKDYERLVDLYSTSHLFILPTKAECAGIVFSESSLYGLPIITYDTGGISNYVVNGVNGYRMPIRATANDFACMIENMLQKNELERLSEGATKYASSTLNWAKWTTWFKQTLK